MGEKAYGSYTVMRVSQDPMREEWTNIGVIVFDQNGDGVYFKVNTDRAVARGDMSPEFAASLDRTYKAYEHESQVTRALESMGHMMSCVQVRGLLPCKIRDNYDDLFELFVLGKRRD